MADPQYAPQGFYPKGIDWNEPLRQESLIDLLDRAVSNYSDNIALSHRGYKLTYKEFGEIVDSVALGLTEKIKPGDRIGLFMPNTPHYPIMFFAALKAGAVVVNFSSTYQDHPEKLAAQIADSGTTIMATSDLKGFYSTAKTVMDEGKLPQIVICPLNTVLPFWTSLAFRFLKQGKLADAPDYKDPRISTLKNLAVMGGYVDNALPVVDKNQLAVLQYTNGTTGVPKGVMLSHFNIATNVAQLEKMFGYRPGREPAGLIFPGREKFLTSIPMFHVYGLTIGMLNAISMGAEIITVPDPRDIKGLLKIIDKEKPTVFPAVPKMLGSIASRKDLNEYDLTSLRCVTSGGAALPSTVRAAFEKATGCTVRSGYGLSETSPVVTSEPPSGPAKPNSIGVPYPGTEIRIVDALTLADVPRGIPGELLIRGPQVMQGYWQHPEATAKSMVDGEWFRTGDTGFYDEDGFISLTGRNKRMASINGMKISPETIEEAIMQHPSILECCVIRININQEKESLRAIIRYRPDATDRPDESGWRRLLREKLTDKEIPRTYEFRTEPLPMVGGIKPDWNLLEQEEAAHNPAAVKPAPIALNPQ